MKFRFLGLVVFSLAFALASAPANAARCGNTSKGFNGWLTQFKKEARRKGISKRTAAQNFA